MEYETPKIVRQPERTSLVARERGQTWIVVCTPSSVFGHGKIKEWNRYGKWISKTHGD